MTLRARLAVVAALVTAVLAVGGVAIVTSIARSEQRQVDRRLRTAVPITFRIAPPDAPRPVERADQREHFSDVYVARLEAGGTSLSTSVNPVWSGSTPLARTTGPETSGSCFDLHD